jgi:hypothetical protein
MQPHPELNHTIIQDIIDRLTGLGRLDERQRAQCERQLKSDSYAPKPRQHIMLRIIAEFLGIFD